MAMRSGQLLFVILFIIAITIFSFLREKKKKPRVIFFGKSQQNKDGFISQLQKIAGYAYDFSWENIQGTEDAAYFEAVEKSIHSTNPKAIFLQIDLTISILRADEYQPINILPFENFCRRNALSLQEKRILLVIILKRSEVGHFELIGKTLAEFSIPFINLDEIIEPQNNADEETTLSQLEIEKLSSKVSQFLDSFS
ncbi:MAG: hypothetical protein ABIY35_04750 [Chitinophagaceae bacterium]